MTESKKLAVPCEIYSRVVGYFRPVQNWNEGKKQEFSERNYYNSGLELRERVRA